MAWCRVESPHQPLGSPGTLVSRSSDRYVDQDEADSAGVPLRSRSICRPSRLTQSASSSRITERGAQRAVVKRAPAEETLRGRPEIPRAGSNESIPGDEQIRTALSEGERASISKVEVSGGRQLLSTVTKTGSFRPEASPKRPLVAGNANQWRGVRAMSLQNRHMAVVPVLYRGSRRRELWCRGEKSATKPVC
jgi:hypothetical protein